MMKILLLVIMEWMIILVQYLAHLIIILISNQKTNLLIIMKLKI